MKTFVHRLLLGRLFLLEKMGENGSFFGGKTSLEGVPVATGVCSFLFLGFILMCCFLVCVFWVPTGRAESGFNSDLVNPLDMSGRNF